MRRLIVACTVVACIACVPACRMKKKASAKSDKFDGQPLSVVNVADPHAAMQLTRGFYGLENNSWRWTMKNFTVTLRPPAGSAQTGARLQLKFTVPEVMYNRVGDMTLDAHVNGIDLGAEKLTKAGEALYDREVPASVFGSDLVTFDFVVDKGLPPGERDTRELALIVSAVGLVPK
jgi:hypothetical protein